MSFSPHFQHRRGTLLPSPSSHILPSSPFPYLGDKQCQLSDFTDSKTEIRRGPSSCQGMYQPVSDRDKLASRSAVPPGFPSVEASPPFSPLPEWPQHVTETRALCLYLCPRRGPHRSLSPESHSPAPSVTSTRFQMVQSLPAPLLPLLQSLSLSPDAPGPGMQPNWMSGGMTVFPSALDILILSSNL